MYYSTAYIPQRTIRAAIARHGIQDVLADQNAEDNPVVIGKGGQGQQARRGEDAQSVAEAEMPRLLEEEYGRRKERPKLQHKHTPACQVWHSQRGGAKSRRVKEACLLAGDEERGQPRVHAQLCRQQRQNRGVREVKEVRDHYTSHVNHHGADIKVGGAVDGGGTPVTPRTDANGRSDHTRLRPAFRSVKMLCFCPLSTTFRPAVRCAFFCDGTVSRSASTTAIWGRRRAPLSTLPVFVTYELHLLLQAADW